MAAKAIIIKPLGIDTLPPLFKASGQTIRACKLPAPVGAGLSMSWICLALGTHPEHVKEDVAQTISPIRPIRRYGG